MSEEFKERTRKEQQSFTRKRKLPFHELMLFILKGAYKSLNVEVQNFLRSLGRKTTMLSKQAISKAREKINHHGFVMINDTIVRSFYEESHVTYKGYRLLAADGSMLVLPEGECLREAFGQMNHRADWSNTGWAMSIYDPLNNLIVQSELHAYGNSEQGYVLSGLRRMQEEGLQRSGDLIITDRGFPSLQLMLKLKEMGYDFVMRYNGEYFLKEFRGFPVSPENEAIISITLGSKESVRWRKLQVQQEWNEGLPEEVLVRVVKIKLNNGITEYLVSSVLEKEKLSREELGKIYQQRWMVEEWYKTAKTTMEIENFSGKTPENILQDYHAKIAMFNLHSVVVVEAQRQLDAKVSERTRGDRLKYEEYEINQNVSYGLVREAITDLLQKEEGDWGSIYDHLVEIVQSNPIPKRRGRNNPRERKWKNKFPSNQRRAV